MRQSPCAQDCSQRIHIDAPTHAPVPAAESQGALPLAMAWYRRWLTLPPRSSASSTFWLEFDGVTTDAVVFLNGRRLGAHRGGYLPFVLPLPLELFDDAGGPADVSSTTSDDGAARPATALLAVHVDATRPRSASWWYDGGGITRDVRLCSAGAVHVRPLGGVHVRSQLDPAPHMLPRSVAGATVRVETSLMVSHRAAVPEGGGMVGRVRVRSRIFRVGHADLRSSPPPWHQRNAGSSHLISELAGAKQQRGEEAALLAENISAWMPYSQLTSPPPTLQSQLQASLPPLVPPTAIDHAGGVGALASASLTVSQRLRVADAELWSIDSPSLYSCVTVVELLPVVGARPKDPTASPEAALVVDVVETRFGIRSIEWSGSRKAGGLILNGKRVELHGVANHEDMGGVGVALPASLQWWRVWKVKALLGANAWRTAHHPPSPALLDACDALGVIVILENHRLGDSDEALADLREMILRDRARPSIVAWSLCNEVLCKVRDNDGPPRRARDAVARGFGKRRAGRDADATERTSARRLRGTRSAEGGMATASAAAATGGAPVQRGVSTAPTPEVGSSTDGVEAEEEMRRENRSVLALRAMVRVVRTLDRPADPRGIRPATIAINKGFHGPLAQAVRLVGYNYVRSRPVLAVHIHAAPMFTHAACVAHVLRTRVAHVPHRECPRHSTRVCAFRARCQHQSVSCHPSGAHVARVCAHAAPLTLGALPCVASPVHTHSIPRSTNAITRTRRTTRS